MSTREHQGQRSEDVPSVTDRRCGPDRRRRIARGLIQGSRTPRRRSARREGDHGFTHVDWHDARWLGVAVLILLLSAADAVLTLTLVRHGANEANPLMAPLVAGGGRGFAIGKLVLTGLGVVLLTPLARFRMFGRFPAGVLLYLTLAGYVALVGYEWLLLERLMFVDLVLWRE